jgi:diguanylate cyclase (GGDEF)-like protein/PAS domain S-box-containing protein
VHRVVDYVARISRAAHDPAAALSAGAEAAAEITGSAALVVVLEPGGPRLAALRDPVAARGEVVSRAMATVALDGPDSPFATALATGQNALLGIAALAFSGPGPAWAGELDRLGIAFLGLTPLLARERTLGILVTARLVDDPPMTTAHLADQAQVAGHLATSLDNAAALAQMRQSSLVVDAMPDAVIGFSRDREVILWNHGAEQMYGIPEAEALGQRLDDLITTEYGPTAAGQGGPAISLINKGSWTGRVRQRSRAGRTLHADVSIASIVEGGVLRGAVSINRDVTGLIEAEAQRAEDERRMQALLDASRAMTAVFDRDGIVVAVNSAWTAHVSLGGIPAGDVGVGSDYVAALRRVAGSSADAAAVLAGLEAVLAGRAEAFEWDYDVAGPDGQVRAYMVSVAPMPGSQGGAFATHTDITARKHMERQLSHQASHDPLTGLGTRRRLEQELEAALARSAGRGLGVGAIIADLDRFKDVNDTLGHEAGDQVLVQMAARLRSFEPATAIGRLAGDEFALLLPDVRDRAELARLAGDLARLITAPLPLGDRELFFGVNIGTALSADTDGGPDAAANLLRAADTAMYRAKARGRNSIVAYDEGLRADVDRRVQISTWLNHALARGEFTVAYQPQFRCLDGRQVGVEALVRWHHPEAGDISPAEFVSIAEESGAIIPIGAWVLGEACRRAAGWAPIAGPDFTIAVNLSPHQLIDPGLLDIVRSALLRSRLPATSLTLEVTEGALIDDPEAATEALAKLRALGVRISLDDFGTGYSSLAYLAKFPVDELKVDRVFVRDIERDPRTRALAEGIVRIGHALGMRVLAEGVETAGQLRILTGAGCDCYQGFIAAPAESAERATERIRDRTLGRDIPADAAMAAGRTISVYP